jgi:trk system potassium uptake protein TrkA
MKAPLICVIGLGAFGFELALELSRRGACVTAIDRNGDLVGEIADQIARPLVADVTDMTMLKQLHLESFDVVCVAIVHELLPVLTVLSVMEEEKAMDKLYCRLPRNKTFRLLYQQLGLKQLLDFEYLAASRVAEELCEGY